MTTKQRTKTKTPITPPNNKSTIYIFITLAVFIAAVILRSFSIGFITIVTAPILVIFTISYFGPTIMFSRLQAKTKIQKILFLVILCATLLYAITFIDSPAMNGAIGLLAPLEGKSATPFLDPFNISLLSLLVSFIAEVFLTLSIFLSDKD